VSGGQPALTLRSKLAEQTDIDATALPYNHVIVEWPRAERSAGGRIVRATASHERIAKRVAEHLAKFDKVFASNYTLNLWGQRKRDGLFAAYGEQAIDYVGNSHDDVPIWRAADRAYVVHPRNDAERAARRCDNVERLRNTPEPPRSAGEVVATASGAEEPAYLRAAASRTSLTRIAAGRIGAHRVKTGLRRRADGGRPDDAGSARRELP
jgi:hypothetical protein